MGEVAGRVSGFRWGSFGVVGCGVVFSAEEGEVGEGGITAVGPVDDVVRVAP